MSSDGLELDPCRHGEQNHVFCLICKDEEPRERETVYFTSGGQNFHRTTSCMALSEGEKIVSDRGGTPAAIESGYLDVLKITRNPCKTCAR